MRHAISAGHRMGLVCTFALVMALIGGWPNGPGLMADG